MPIMDCLQKTTNRQFLAWQEWIKLQANKPGTLEYYLMSIACEVRRGYSQHPNSVNLEHMRLEFRDKATAANEDDRKKHLANMKAIWMGRVVGKGGKA